MMKRLTLSILILLASLSAYADSEAPPSPYSVTSQNGQFIFKMVPDQNNLWASPLQGSGVLIEIKSDGTEEELWKTEGWYAYTVHISNDGKYLIRQGPWPRGRTPKKEDLAIAFYQEGKLIKSYSTTDLIEDLSKVRSSVSHYMWIRNVRGLTSPEGYEFELETMDNIIYTFDIRTGDYKTQKPNFDEASKT